MLPNLHSDGENPDLMGSSEAHHLQRVMPHHATAFKFCSEHHFHRSVVQSICGTRTSPVHLHHRLNHGSSRACTTSAFSPAQTSHIGSHLPQLVPQKSWLLYNLQRSEGQHTFSCITAALVSSRSSSQISGLWCSGWCYHCGFVHTDVSPEEFCLTC